ARSRGVDLRAAGSGNVGATNVGRLLGTKIGVLVFLLDFAKGALPVAVARWVSPEAWVAVAAGLAAFLGHIFPVRLGFRGGRVGATGAGVVAVLMPLPTLGAAIVWLTLFCSMRYVSLASIIAAICLFAFHLASEPKPFAPGMRIVTGFCVVAAALV